MTNVSPRVGITAWPDEATQERTRRALLETLPGRLAVFERRHGLPSAAVEAAMTAGTLPDIPETCEWALLYDLYRRIVSKEEEPCHSS